MAEFLRNPAMIAFFASDCPGPPARSTVTHSPAAFASAVTAWGEARMLPNSEFTSAVNAFSTAGTATRFATAAPTWAPNA